METFVVGGTTSDGHLFLCLLCGEVYTSEVGKCLGLSPVISITLLRASKANNPILSNFFLQGKECHDKYFPIQVCLPLLFLVFVIQVFR